MRRQWMIWILVWLVMFGSAWVYAGTLKASSPNQIALLPLDVTVRPAAESTMRPLPAVGAPADPFAPEVGGQPQPTAPPPPAPIPLPPPPLPEPPAAPPSTAPPAEAAPFKLTGIVVGAVKRAVLEVKETAYIVKEGDTVEGWTVVRIEPRRVILRSPAGEEVTLELESGPGSAPAPSP